MQKFTDTITAAGNGGVLTPLANASVTVYVTGTNTLAPLYSDNGVTAKTNPFTSTGTGLVEFYAPDDRYDIVVAKTGFSTVTVADIIFEDIDDVVTTDISHADIVDSSFSDGTIVDSAVQNSTLTGNTIVDGTMDGTTATDLDISASAIDESDITGGTADGVTITGSTVNSTPIGASAPSIGKFTSVQLASGATGTIGFGEIRLNSNELTLDVGMSGGVVGQMFEEHFISFTNTSGQAMVSGQVVGFAGVDNVNSIPYGQLVTANPAYNPLYTMGIVTQDIGNGAYGRATMFGKVRNINTTGFQVSEVWAPGDLLYIHPTIPGAMTNIEPAVPSQSLLMAAVLRVGATTGTILVRPQLTAHLHYATYASHVTQAVAAVETPTVVAFEVMDIESGPTIVDNTKIYPQQAGLQDFGFTGQLAKSSSNTSYVWIWGRKNGVDIPDSARKVSVAGSGTNVVVSWDFMVPMEATDYFEVVWAADDTGVKLTAVAQETFCPSIPSAQISVKLASH
jgi:hypothetical protein